MSALLALGSPAKAETEVDVELVLAVDVSRSMSPRELEIQRRGYAEALTSQSVIKAIRSGLLGRIALRYMEWSGYGQQRVIVEWTLIETAEDAEKFARKLTAQFNEALRKTSISDAIAAASLSFVNNGFSANRQVIDISGDGPNNSGAPVEIVRDHALSKGIIINGLPLMTREGMGSQFHLADLDDYYRHCVIGGPGSFVIPVTEWKQFPSAVRQKLILELAERQHSGLVLKASFTGKTADGYDCLIGEKMWNQFIQRYPYFGPDN